METIYFKKTTELRRNLERLQDTLKVKINLVGRKVEIEGDPLDEYEALLVLDAINFGFSANQAIQIKDPEIDFKILNIKEFTRRANLKEVRGRLIGSKGQTRRVLEDISGCEIIVNNDNTVGIIGEAEAITRAVTAVSNLIRGSKQSNVYRYLERMNRERKKNSDEI